MSWRCGRIIVGAIAAAALVGAAQQAWAHGTTVRVSVGAGGVQANGPSGEPTISPNGRFVAFISAASNLVAGDTNKTSDVFIRDRQTGTNERVSVSSSGAQANDYSAYRPAVSADGRFIAFTSFATNLVPGDTNGEYDVFVRDRQTAKTQRVSVSSGGAQANGFSNFAGISVDGRFVAFTSGGSNLVPGDTNGTFDVFVRDMSTNVTERVSVSSGGAQGNDGSSGSGLSAGGRYVIFASYASNLVSGDTNDALDIFVRDRWTKTTRRVSLGSRRQQAESECIAPAISGDGRVVAFTSADGNLVAGDTNAEYDIFARDLRTGTTERVNVDTGGRQSNGFSNDPALSFNGHYVAFMSEGSNLVSDDGDETSDIFRHNRVNGATRLASPGPAASPGVHDGSSSPAISSDGQTVAFASPSSDLVPKDTNSAADVFLRIFTP